MTKPDYEEEMYCAVEGCGRVDESHTAYCIVHGRSTHKMRFKNNTHQQISRGDDAMKPITSKKELGKASIKYPVTYKPKTLSAGANNHSQKFQLNELKSELNDIELVDKRTDLVKSITSDTHNRTSELEKAVWRINKEKEYNELYIKLDDLECEIKEDFSGVLIKKGNISYIFQLIRSCFFSKMIKELKSNWSIIQSNNNMIFELERKVGESELKGIKSERERCLKIIDKARKCPNCNEGKPENRCIDYTVTRRLISEDK